MNHKQDEIVHNLNLDEFNMLWTTHEKRELKKLMFSPFKRRFLLTENGNGPVKLRNAMSELGLRSRRYGYVVI